MEKLGAFITGKFMHSVLLLLVVINAVILGLEAESALVRGYEPLIQQIDFIVLTVLTISISLRVIVFRTHFFEYGWNTFDLVVVTAAVIGHNTDIALLKTLRVLMVFRIIVFFPTMRMLVEALIYAFKGIVSSIVILSIVFYAFSVAGYYLFQNAPGDSFTTLGISFASLFQLMLFDDFGNITKPIIAVMPESWIFFISFLFATAFSFINLLIGIFVEAIDEVHKANKDNKGLKAKKVGALGSS
ncbi:MAG: ion transporter [Alphaproteobacteria bacterium]|nr:ion transporter [Alphaproteobacteria bacterium]NCQ66713.1 ion transporter [Alphaproteobacteria bacterium]NCT07163.1 ion transporter [Alphaproteobacteria bacterium]